MGALFHARLEVLKSSPLVGVVRGVEAVEDKVAKSVATPARPGLMMNVAMHYNGLISCDMTDAVAFCPAMIITRRQADSMFEIIARSLAEVEAEAGA